jgi:integrase
MGHGSWSGSTNRVPIVPRRCARGGAGFLDLLRTDEELCRLDIGDLFAFMSFTGCRIGEALDLRWSRVDSSTAR